MRKEPFGVGSMVHILKRGARGLPITREVSDQWRFVRLLYHLNDEYKDDFWEENTLGLGKFERNTKWPERRELVKIMAWVLMPNHFHLLVEEVNEGGVSRFMQKLCGSMSTHYNRKYKEKGSLFQGAYKARAVNRDEHFKHLFSYIMVKNVFEVYPGGFKKAAQRFDEAWKWGVEEYPFSSLPDYINGHRFPVMNINTREFFDSKNAFRSVAKDTILNRLSREESSAWTLE